MNLRVILRFSILLFLAIQVSSCGDSSNVHYIDSNVSHHIYQVGEHIVYKGGGNLLCYDSTLYTDGYYEMNGEFRIDIFAENKKSPYFPDVPLMSLRETFTMSTDYTDTSGTTSNTSSVSTAYRYFNQDNDGTITFYGDSIWDWSVSSIITVWSKIPYIPINSPYYVGEQQYAAYIRYKADDGSYYDSEQTLVSIQSTEVVTTPIGSFETFKMLFQNGNGENLRYQYTYPAIGVVKFSFYQPGCSGEMMMDLNETNISY